MIKKIKDYGIKSVMLNGKRIGNTFSILGENRYYDRFRSIQYSIPNDAEILDESRPMDITYILARYLQKKEGFYFHPSRDYGDIISLIVADNREKIKDLLEESKRDGYREYTHYINMMLKEFNHPLWEKGLFDMDLSNVTDTLPQEFIDKIGKQIIQRNMGLEGIPTKEIEDFFNIQLTFGRNTCQLILKELVFHINMQ